MIIAHLMISLISIKHSLSQTYFLLPLVFQPWASCLGIYLFLLLPFGPLEF